MANRSAQRYRFGPFLLDPARRRLERRGRELPLQPKVFSTLLYLVERSDRVVPREELLDALWPGEFVTDNVLSRSIREVRRALGDRAGDPAFVRTVPRVGYHFVGEVRGPSPPAESAAVVRTVAVLPFRPLVPRAGDESLEIGMADTLITRLSNLPDLVVRPLSAVRGYTGVDQDPLEAGREQRADAVVEGGIQLREARLRVTVRVLRVADGSALVADTFDEPSTGIFGVQDAICRRIADALALKLSGSDARRLEKRHTESTEAYRLYLLGRLHLGRRTEEGARASLDSFRKAIEEDPGFALAYAGLADAYDSLGTLGLATAERFDAARRAAERALALDPELPQAFCTLGKVAWEHDWDWEAADGFFRRATGLAPNDADVRIAYSDFCSYLGRSEEAVAQARRALELDPVSPWVNALLAQALHMGGRHEDAVAQAERALEVAPGFAFAHLFLGLALLELGRPDEALAQLERARAGSDRLDFAGALGYARGRAGDGEGARAILAELSEADATGGAPPLAFAMVHMGLGEDDRAFEWLEAAVAERSWHVLLLHAEPVFERLRSDPRAEDLLRRIGVR